MKSTKTVIVGNGRYTFVYSGTAIYCYDSSCCLMWTLAIGKGGSSLLPLLDIAEKHDKTIKYIDNAIKGLEESDDAPVAFSREDVVALLLLVRDEMVRG